MLIANSSLGLKISHNPTSRNYDAHSRPQFSSYCGGKYTYLGAPIFSGIPSTSSEVGDIRTRGFSNPYSDQFRAPNTSHLNWNITMDLSFNTIRRLPRVEPTGQIIVFNLDSRIVDSDVVNLFIRCGPLWSAEVHYDSAGRSLGSADVIFERKNDAIKVYIYRISNLLKSFSQLK